MAYNKYGGNQKEGDNAKYMLFLADLTALPKIDLKEKDAEEKLHEHIRKYIQICADHDMRMGQANFALSLHLSRQQLQRHLAGVTKIPPEVFELLHLVNNMMATGIEDGLLTGTINVVGGIYISKNNYGYKDQTEQLIIHEDKRLSAEELKALADNLPDVIEGEYKEIGEDE